MTVAFTHSEDEREKGKGGKGGRRLSAMLGRMGKKLDNQAARGSSRLSTRATDGDPKSDKSWTKWVKRGDRSSTRRFSLFPSARPSTMDADPDERGGVAAGSGPPQQRMNRFSMRFSTRNLQVAPNNPDSTPAKKGKEKKTAAKKPILEEDSKKGRAERIKEKTAQQELEKKKKEEERRKRQEEEAELNESALEKRVRCAARACGGGS